LLTDSSHCPWISNCVGINNHRHFFLYLINMTLGVITFDWILYYCKDLASDQPVATTNHCAQDFSNISADASESCNILGSSLCKLVNADAYTLIVGMWASLQLTWVSMLLFVQFVQVSRAMTTYENMFGIHDASLTSAFTSTGTPLDPNHPSLAAQGASAHGHGHKHKSRFQTWARLLGVDPFIETITGRGAATGKNKKKKNPYSRGCITNCRDFWCDPQPVFGKRENGASMLGGDPINYTSMYESPAMMEITRGRRRGGYESVAAEEV
jgi:palmitoyltransferase ZDHHC13/17